MDCLNCGKELNIGGDHMYEDYGIDDGEGIVTNLACHDEECGTSVLVFTPDNTDEEDE